MKKKMSEWTCTALYYGAKKEFGDSNGPLLEDETPYKLSTPMCDSTLMCYNNGIDTEETLPNKHLEHLEDLIFTGRKEALTAVWSA